LGFWGPKTLLSAVELGVFTALAKGPLDAGVLRARLRLHPRSTRDFFDALVALGLLDRHDGLYASTPETNAFLDRAKPTYIGAYLEMLDARLYGFWGSLTEAIGNNGWMMSVNSSAAAALEAGRAGAAGDPTGALPGRRRGHGGGPA
jgi:hypothetical protein